MNAAKQNTKDKILDVANSLFASFGYHGTSIRDIAKEADINLASVNYHFKNKLNLYQELFERNYYWMEGEIINLAKDENLNTKEFAWQVYSFFLSNGDHLVNGFKIMLTKDVSCDDMKRGDMPFGPPGQEAFLKYINNDVPDNIPLDAKLWAVRIIFTNIVHSVIMMNTNICKGMEDKTPILQEDFVKLSTFSHVEANLDYIIKNPNKFSPK